MNPNTARAKMIEKANYIIAIDSSSEAAIELAEAVHDLDEWLRAGGFPPDAWKQLCDLARGRATGPLMRDVDI